LRKAIPKIWNSWDFLSKLPVCKATLCNSPLVCFFYIVIIWVFCNHKADLSYYSITIAKFIFPFPFIPFACFLTFFCNYFLPHFNIKSLSRVWILPIRSWILVLTTRHICKWSILIIENFIFSVNPRHPEAIGVWTSYRNCSMRKLKGWKIR